MKQRIKKSYICRNIDFWAEQTEIPFDYIPEAGDVGIFEIVKIGKHKTMQGETKRNVTLVKGDNIMAAFGTRYATAQFEGYLPESVHGELHILGGGGTIGVIKSMHQQFAGTGPTRLRLIALAVDTKGQVLNTKLMQKRRLLPFTGLAASVTKVILSLGSSMDSGKTTSAAYLVHGLKKAGMKVAYIKLTGTVYTKDADLAWDLGADVVADFGDFGFPSTYLCSEEELLSLYESLIKSVLHCQPDYVVIEVADGLYQRETKMLLQSNSFINTVDKVIFSAGDSLAALNGVQLLKRWGIHPLFLSGLLTASPLLIQEVKENCSIPVFTIEDLAGGADVMDILSSSTLMVSNQ